MKIHEISWIIGAFFHHISWSFMKIHELFQLASCSLVLPDVANVYQLQAFPQYWISSEIEQAICNYRLHWLDHDHVCICLKEKGQRPIIWEIQVHLSWRYRAKVNDGRSLAVINEILMNFAYLNRSRDMSFQLQQMSKWRDFVQEVV